MAATAKPAPRPRATPARRAKAQEDARKVEHMRRSIEAAQKDLAAIGGSVGTGVRDLQRDVSKLLRDARRDTVKMGRAVQRDLERLQKDLSAAASVARPSSSRPTSASTNSHGRRATGTR